MISIVLSSTIHSRYFIYSRLNMAREGFFYVFALSIECHGLFVGFTHLYGLDCSKVWVNGQHAREICCYKCRRYWSNLCIPRIAYTCVCTQLIFETFWRFIGGFAIGGVGDFLLKVQGSIVDVTVCHCCQINKVDK